MRSTVFFLNINNLKKKAEFHLFSSSFLLLEKKNSNKTERETKVRQKRRHFAVSNVSFSSTTNDFFFLGGGRFSLRKKFEKKWKKNASFSFLLLLLSCFSLSVVWWPKWGLLIGDYWPSGGQPPRPLPLPSFFLFLPTFAQPIFANVHQFYRVSTSRKRVYLVLPSFLVFSLAFPSFNGFYLLFPTFTGFCLVLPSFA